MRSRSNRKNFVKKSLSITGSDTASFTATTASAPTGMTATTETDFVFFINGQYMEHDALEVEQKTNVLFCLCFRDFGLRKVGCKLILALK